MRRSSAAVDYGQRTGGGGGRGCNECAGPMSTRVSAGGAEIGCRWAGTGERRRHTQSDSAAPAIRRHPRGTCSPPTAQRPAIRRHPRGTCSPPTAQRPAIRRHPRGTCSPPTAQHPAEKHSTSCICTCTRLDGRCMYICTLLPIITQCCENCGAYQVNIAGEDAGRPAFSIQTIFEYTRKRVVSSCH